MMHNLPGLYDMLNQSLGQINALLAAQEKQLHLDVEVAVRDGRDRISIYELVDGSGKSPLTDLVAAKAQILSGMVSLKAADMQSRKKPGGGW